MFFERPANDVVSLEVNIFHYQECGHLVRFPQRVNVIS